MTKKELEEQNQRLAKEIYNLKLAIMQKMLTCTDGISTTIYPGDRALYSKTLHESEKQQVRDIAIRQITTETTV